MLEANAGRRRSAPDPEIRPVRRMSQLNPTAAIFALGLLAAAAPLAGSAPASDCGNEPLGAGNVRRVIDGRTIQLEAGRLVRLAAIEVPPMPLPQESGPETKAGLAAKAALEAILAGRNVTLKKLGPDADRYGRVVAHVFVENQELSAQQQMLAQGFARVGPDVGSQSCASVLLAAENIARRDGAGLWRDPSYAVARADNPAKVLAERGRFTLVEGKVLSVRERRGTIYLNFGRRWSTDFTVTVAKRNESAFAGAGIALKKLAGRTIRVRGFIEERGGPWIEAAHPEQIELADNS
jgi:endonuclease YncB( thermonuclease family)